MTTLPLGVGEVKRFQSEGSRSCYIDDEQQSVMPEESCRNGELTSTE